jgi:hypothetical protein
MMALGAGFASASDGGPRHGGDLLGSGTVLSAPVSITGTAVSVVSGDVAATGQSDDGDVPNSDTALVAAPVLVQDNAIAVLSADASPSGTTAARVADADGAASVTGGSTLASVPIAVVGTAVTVFGDAGATDTAGAAAAGRSDASVVNAPVTVCGTTAAVLGDAASACADQPDASGASLVSAPVTVCGTSAAVAGDSTSTCADQPDASGASLISAPVTVCGTSLAVFGQSHFACPTFASSGTAPLTSVDAVPAAVPEMGAEAAPAGLPEQPTAPAAEARPDAGFIDLGAASGSLSPTGGLAYTGLDLVGTVTAGALMLVLGAGGAIGVRRRGNALAALAS